jgi:hypothetical protein
MRVKSVDFTVVNRKEQETLKNNAPHQYFCYSSFIFEQPKGTL